MNISNLGTNAAGFIAGWNQAEDTAFTRETQDSNKRYMLNRLKMQDMAMSQAEQMNPLEIAAKQTAYQIEQFKLQQAQDAKAKEDLNKAIEMADKGDYSLLSYYSSNPNANPAFKAYAEMNGLPSGSFAAYDPNTHIGVQATDKTKVVFYNPETDSYVDATQGLEGLKIATGYSKQKEAETNARIQTAMQTAKLIAMAGKNPDIMKAIENGDYETVAKAVVSEADRETEQKYNLMTKLEDYKTKKDVQSFGAKLEMKQSFDQAQSAQALAPAAQMAGIDPKTAAALTGSKGNQAIAITAFQQALKSNGGDLLATKEALHNSGLDQYIIMNTKVSTEQTKAISQGQELLLQGSKLEELASRASKLASNTPGSSQLQKVKQMMIRYIDTGQFDKAELEKLNLNQDAELLVKEYLFAMSGQGVTNKEKADVKSMLSGSNWSTYGNMAATLRNASKFLSDKGKSKIDIAVGQNGILGLMLDPAVAPMYYNKTKSGTSTTTAKLTPETSPGAFNIFEGIKR